MHNLTLKHFYYPKRKSVYSSSSSLFNNSPYRLHRTHKDIDLPFVSIELSILEFSNIWNHTIPLYKQKLIFSRFNNIAACTSASFLLIVESYSFVWIYHVCFFNQIHQWMGIQVTSPFCYYELFGYGHLCAVSCLNACF